MELYSSIMASLQTWCWEASLKVGGFESWRLATKGIPNLYGITIVLIGFLGAPKSLASFKVSRSHSGFLFSEGCSQTGLSSSKELLEVEGPKTYVAGAGEPTTSEVCDPIAMYGEPVTWEPKPVPEDPAGWTTETGDPVPILCGPVTPKTCEAT